MIVAVKLTLSEAAALATDRLRAGHLRGHMVGESFEGWTVRSFNGRLDQMDSISGGRLTVTALGEDGRHGKATTSDFSESGVIEVVTAASAAASIGDSDPWMTLLPTPVLGLAETALAIDDPEWQAFTAEQGFAMSAATEAAARAADPRVGPSGFCNASSKRRTRVLATTDGIRLSWHATSVGLQCLAVARSDDERQSFFEESTARHWRRLRSPSVVGDTAAKSACAKFGWRRAPAGPAPVLLDARTAGEFLALLGQALSGGAIYRGRSWCTGLHGTDLASPLVTIEDAPLMHGAIGSRPCDDEGARSRDLVVVEDGRLVSYLVDGYAARRLDHPYTAHAGGPSNLRLRAGKASRDDLAREMRRGLLVTGFTGFSVDLASGEFSRGASGFWVEDGKIAHPIQEVTIAGRLPELWQGIRAIGNDPDPESAIASPSLLIDGFIIGA